MTCLHEAPIIVGAIDCDIPKQRAQNAAQGHFIVVPIQDGRDIEKSQNGLGVSRDGHPAYTIDGTGAQALAYSIREDAAAKRFSATEVQTSIALQAHRPSVQSHHAQLFIAQKAFRKSKRAQTDSDDETWVDDGLANTLNGFDTGDSRTTHAVVSPPLTASNDPSRSPQSSEVTNQIAAVAQASCGMVVRRLMPEECELLQGFPVGWTNIGSVEKPTADTHRYKQLGNAVTVNVAQWLAARCANELLGGSPDA